MTTMSVMVALLPIASGLEEGSELLQAAAVVLIGGLLTSTLLTLVFVPAMYTIFDDMQAGVVGLFRRLTGSRPAPALATASSEAPTATYPAVGGHASRPLDGRPPSDGRPSSGRAPEREPGHSLRNGGPRQRASSALVRNDVRGLKSTSTIVPSLRDRDGDVLCVP